MPYKIFANGFPLNASELNTFLMSQSIAVFTDSTARTAAIAAPVEGQYTYLTGSNVLEFYNGSAWVAAIPSEVEYLTGVTSNIQTQLNDKQAIVSGVSDTEIGYLDGVTSAIQTQLNAKENASYTVSNISANYTLLSGDASKLIVSTGSAVTVTVANVLTVGQRIDFLQDGTGQITFAAGSGVTLQSKSGNLKTSAQESAASVICIASGQYRLIGDLAA
jgi:hypothetical protein